MKWPPRNKAKNKNRREYYRVKKDGTKYNKPNFEYQCNSCKNWFPDKDIQLDHIIPVVNPKDTNNYTEEEFIGKFAVSLLCYEDGWQNLCNPCHDAKTEKENKIRMESKNT